jgi:DNA-binding response OmpR family regulator
MDAFLMNSLPASKWSGSDGNNLHQVRLAASRRSPPLGTGSPIAAVRPLRVLIVDDHHDAADTMSTLVQLWGHDASCAYDGATGLAIATTMLPDVVLLDLVLPRLNGCQLAVQLRQAAGLQDCFLIAVTGCGDEKQRLRSQAAGIDVFLIKPVESLVMETLLMLERRRLRMLTTFDAESKTFAVLQEAVRV